jgi:hypothetical protein
MSPQHTPTLLPMVLAWGLFAKSDDRHLLEFANGYGLYPNKADADECARQYNHAYTVKRVQITVPSGQAEAGARGAGASQQVGGNNTGPESLRNSHEQLVAALGDLIEAIDQGDSISAEEFGECLTNGRAALKTMEGAQS